MKVAVIGAAGYAGGELLRLLHGHPAVRECVASSRSQAGKPLAEVHPGLRGLSRASFEGGSPLETARGADVVFLALEHGESARIAGELLRETSATVIDIAADFRVRDLELYRRYYGEHPDPETVARFRYGLADVAGTSLRGARAIALPGCFATAAQLALYPLAGEPGIEPALFAVTGSSGSGVQPRATTHHPARAHNLFAYSVQQHRHEAEILGQWREWTGRPNAAVRLMTHSGPFVRGIYLTLWAQATLDQESLVARYASAYQGRPFVHVGTAPPELTHAVGSNHALVGVAASGRDVQVMVAIDNLVKGAGGQGVQAMNLALGFGETDGLDTGTMFPC